MDTTKCSLRAIDGKAEIVDVIVERLGPPVTRSDVLRWHSAGSKTWAALEARSADIRRKRGIA